MKTLFEEEEVAGLNLDSGGIAEILHKPLSLSIPAAILKQ